jgi:hypothetical protein
VVNWSILMIEIVKGVMMILKKDVPMIVFFDTVHTIQRKKRWSYSNATWKFWTCLCAVKTTIPRLDIWHHPHTVVRTEPVDVFRVTSFKQMLTETTGSFIAWIKFHYVVPGHLRTKHEPVNHLRIGPRSCVMWRACTFWCVAESDHGMSL